LTAHHHHHHCRRIDNDTAAIECSLSMSSSLAFLHHKVGSQEDSYKEDPPKKTVPKKRMLPRRMPLAKEDRSQGECRSLAECRYQEVHGSQEAPAATGREDEDDDIVTMGGNDNKVRRHIGSRWRSPAP
jgi:hypothetical protein